MYFDNNHIVLQLGKSNLSISNKKLNLNPIDFKLGMMIPDTVRYNVESVAIL